MCDNRIYGRRHRCHHHNQRVRHRRRSHFVIGPRVVVLGLLLPVLLKNVCINLKRDDKSVWFIYRGFSLILNGIHSRANVICLCRISGMCWSLFILKRNSINANQIQKTNIFASKKCNKTAARGYNIANEELYKNTEVGLLIKRTTSAKLIWSCECLLLRWYFVYFC